MRKILVLVNPLFERYNRRDLPLVLEVFRQSGAEIEVEETTADRGSGELARRAIEQGVDAIIVCGGDGTVFDVLQGMAGSAVPLGIIPFGTGNVLAQNLRIPKKPVAAARALLSARPRTVPLGRLTFCTKNRRQSWLFAMTAGMGVHAAMMTATLHAKKNVRGRAAYFLAGLQLLFRHPLEPFEVEITTTAGDVIRRHVCEAIAVRVSELNLWRPGGGFDLPFLRLATVETEPEQNGSRWRISRATYEGLFRSAGSRDRKPSRNAPARYEDVARLVCRPIPEIAYQVPLAVQADGEVLDATCATIEMADVSLRMLSLEVGMERAKT